MDDPDLVDRRIRNRIIEYLELASSYQDQLDYEAGTTIASVPHEIINQWEDWTHGDSTTWPQTLNRGVYSLDEVVGMQRFHATWDSVGARTPNPLPVLVKLQATSEWDEIRRAASEALAIFLRRGRLSE